MNSCLTIKKINNDITIYANSKLNFNAFIDALKKKLGFLYIKKELLNEYFILDISNIELDSRKIINIFDVFADFENILLKKVIFKKNNVKNISLYEGNIRSGEVKLFPNNTLVIGSINSNGKIIVNGNLYVLGSIMGCVELKSLNNAIYASKINNASIKICQYSKVVDIELLNKKIFIKDETIIIDDISNKGEHVYGKSNCSYIW